MAFTKRRSNKHIGPSIHINEGKTLEDKEKGGHDRCMRKIFLYSRIVYAIMLTIALLYCDDTVFAQQVYVFDEDPPALGSTEQLDVNDDDRDQKILVIPVVTQDTAFDPANNSLNSFDPALPNLRADLQAKFQTVSDFWAENSYGRVSFETTVLDCYYQMPRGLDFYFNPAFVSPILEGSRTLMEPVQVPAGKIELHLHISDADETIIPINFDAADSPYLFADLQTTIADQLSPLAGDKLSVIVTGGAEQSIKFTVGQRHVLKGTFVTVRYAQSDPKTVDALGLDTPKVSFAPVRAISTGSEFPVTLSSAGTLTLQVENSAGATEDFVWNVPSGTINTVADFVTAQGTTNANATITETEGELQFDVAPTIAGPIESLTFTTTGNLDLDVLGLDKTTEDVGVVSHVDRNTVKGHRPLLMGQAIAAYMMYELEKPPSSADDIPQLDVTAANENQIRQTFHDFIDPYRSLTVLFLDALGKREGAGGGFINSGIENGDYLFQYQTYGNVQIAFRTTADSTFTHEIGHNIGFKDLYNNSGGNYDPALEYPNNWDMMDNQGRFPHTGAWEKERLATWISRNGAGIEWFPAPATPGVETRRYVLTPIEFSKSVYDDNLAVIPAGRTLTKQINLSLGLGTNENDHYLIVQNRQPGASFSQTLPQASGALNRGGVYITDTITRKSYNYFKITSRNYVHPLTDKPLVSGDVSPVLDAAPLEDIDIVSTYPSYAGITVDIVGQLLGPAAGPGSVSYLVDISREQSDFLDLRITPWGAPPWETIDIWVEHGNEPLSLTPLPDNGEAVRWSPDYDPAANGGVPLNYIRVQVTNAGTVEATDVQVKLRVNTPGGMGDAGSWLELPLSDPQSIPPGESRIFDFPWNPRVDRHTCLKAEVFRWKAPFSDLDPFNNGTQENVNYFYPTASSPWHSEPVEFTVSNTFDRSIDVEIVPVDLPPGLIFSVDGGFVRTISARSKALIIGKLGIDEKYIPVPLPAGEGQLKPRPRQRTFHVEGYAIAGDYRAFIGGITYNVLPTLDINLEVDVRVDRSGCIVVSGSTEPPAGEQYMEIEVRYPSGRHVWINVKTDSAGTFTETIEPEEKGNVRVAVNYPSGGMFAPTRSADKTVNTEKQTPTSVSELWCWLLVMLVFILLILYLKNKLFR